MPTRKNPCVAAAIEAKAWYQHLNGKTKLIGQTFVIISGIVLGTLWFEGRYAKAEDVAPIKENVSALVAAMTIQSVSRQTVLKLKLANSTITPEEQVELEGLTDMLEALQK